jgi:glycosidase/fibronectin type 3 domain-containing protein
MSLAHRASRGGRVARLLTASAAFGLLASIVAVSPASSPAPVRASHTGDPTSVTVAGSLQQELGCSGDWQADCATTHLTADANDDVWQGTWSVPAGDWEYKAALNDGWGENYGLHAAPGGSNIGFNLAGTTSVKFFYDHKSHWITDNVNSVIATVPGSFQSQLGCSGDWDPACLRSWLQDPDGDGIYRFETTALSAGSYEAKVTIDESWDENYGAGGAPGGANIPFTVPANNAIVKFSYDPGTHVLSILAGHTQNNDVEWNGLHHDSRDLLYRTPGGAVPAGTPVTLRFRTFHGDVSGVKLRTFDVNAGAQSLTSMTLAASDVSCYDPALVSETCDFWAKTLSNASPNNLWYRFVVTDGGDTDYYADNTPALDGGPGAASDDPIDNSYALMVHDPSFTSPEWAKHAVIYQIFPDRFRDGRKDNNAKTGDVRYDDPVLKLPWGTLPEGYCRNYADGAVNCPWRFDDTPPAWSPTKEGPRGRDYMGGDLKGVDQQLDYLASLGVTAIYFNPIFDAASNHSYDTQDYTRVDPYFGTQKDFDNLVKHAKTKGIRVILDGVFNHLSSDSMFFDRYHHYATPGACESKDSVYRSWFTFHDVAPGSGTCVSSAGVANAATYDGWFGFDSIPVLNKSNPQVQAYFLTNPDSIAARWLIAGAGGWRMDVSGDSSFPADYWTDFRGVVKGIDPNALTISETWQKDTTLLRMLRGDRLDTTMNYRLRDAVIGLLAPGAFDSKGFADSGHVINPSEFAARLASIREDYPDAAYYALMNLLDSHDTERLLWTLTPGVETTANKEGDASSVAEGKRRLELATLVQYGVPGAPTVYYGDEVGITGDDDPDDRRTYPWADLGGSPDSALLAHYQALAALRAGNPALTAGDFRILSANDGSGTVAFGRKTSSRAAIVVLNRGGSTQAVTIPVAGFVPDGTAFSVGYGVGIASGGSFVATGGQVSITLPALGGAILSTGATDLAPPAAPTGLSALEGNAQVRLDWNASSGAVGYHVYRSPLTGGGFVRVTGSPVADTDYTDTGLQNGRTYFYVVTALDAAGNESGWSNEASALPHLSIGWANLQWPPTMIHTISAVVRTDNAYGQVWIDGVTNQAGQAPGLRAQLGFGPDGSNPIGNVAWGWVEASFNVDVGNNDEFVASMLPDSVGEFDYLYRYSTTNGRDWFYADLAGPFASEPGNPGDLTVNPSADTTAPSVPTGLQAAEASPAAISLDWDDNVGDATLYGYEVGRSSSSGGPYSVLALVTNSEFTDATVDGGASYHYAVRAVDLSFNRSGYSPDVAATAEARTVTLIFNVTVPASTDGTGRSVYIAGTLNLLDGGLPEWNPGGVVLTRVDATHWTIGLSGREGVQIQYKYTLGDWDHVEKDAACGEISNRLLVLSYGATGTQTVNDTVENWRNVAPCGN